MQLSSIFLGLLSSSSLISAAAVANDKTKVDARSPDFPDLSVRYVSRPPDCEHSEVYDRCALDNPGTCGSIHPISAMQCASMCNDCCSNDCDY